MSREYRKIKDLRRGDSVGIRPQVEVDCIEHCEHFDKYRLFFVGNPEPTSWHNSTVEYPVVKRTELEKAVDSFLRKWDRFDMKSDFIDNEVDALRKARNDV